MQKLQQTIWMIADQLRSYLPANEIMGEIALLLTWNQLAAKPGSSFPPLESVIQGQINLAAAYQQIAKALGQQGEAYRVSKLPNLMASNQAVKELETVANIQETDDISLYNALIGIIFANAEFGDEMVLPEELVELMTSFAMTPTQDVYSPFPRSLQLAAKLASGGSSAYFESQFQGSALSCAATLLTSINWSQSNPIRNPSVLEKNELKHFSNVMMAPPFGLRYKDLISDPYCRFSQNTSNGDVLSIEHGLAHCSGRLVTLAPVGLLFRGAHDYDLRTRLINNGWLEAVIQLPAALLPYTNIPVAVLVIDKQRDPNAKALLCDADQSRWVKQGGRGRRSRLTGWEKIAEIVNKRLAEGPAVLVTQNELKANEYDLSISRYVLGKASLAMQTLAKKEEMARLEDVAELIRAQALKEDKTPQGDEYMEVGPKDIGEDGYVTEPEKCLRLSGRAKDRAELQRLYPGDVLLVTKGIVGKVVLVGDNCGKNWVASQIYQVIRTGPTSPIQSSEFLFRYLASPMVREYLSERTTGTTIPMLSTRDIKGLQIPVPPIEKQNQVCKTHQEILAAHERIRAIQQEISAMDQMYWPLESNEDASDNA